MTRGWEWADSWLLMGLTGEADTLDQVIARMDGINKAIPTREEIAVGLSWLSGAGLAEVGAGMYGLTPRGADFVEEAGGTLSYPTWDRVKAALQLLPHPAARPDVGISEDEYRRALETHNRSVRGR